MGSVRDNQSPVPPTPETPKGAARKHRNGSALNERSSRKTARNGTLGLLAAVNGLNFVDRYLLAGMLPLVAVELALTDTQSGYLQTAFVTAFALISR